MVFNKGNTNTFQSNPANYFKTQIDYEILKSKYDVLLLKQNEMEKIFDELNIDDNFDGLLNFLKILYNNKNEFMEFLNTPNKKNNNISESIIIENSNEYKKILDINSNLEKSNINLQSQLNKMSYRLNELENNKSINNSNDNIIIDTTINQSLEKQKGEYEIKYSNKFIGLNETIETLNSTILELKDDNKKLLKEIDKIKSNKIIKNKNPDDNKNKLYNSIFIFDTIEDDWQKFMSCFTYKDILKMVKLDKFINDDNKVNKEEYKEVYEWMNIYETDEKKLKINYNIRRKLNRCKIIYNKYQNKLKYIKFNINNLSYMKNDEFNEFLDILDEKIKQRKIPNCDFEDLSDIILNENIEDNIKCINNNCNNYYEGYNYYCEVCNYNTKKCENCNDEFITDKSYITECGDC